MPEHYGTNKKKQPQTNVVRAKVKNLFKKYKRAQDGHQRDFDQENLIATARVYETKAAGL